MYQADEKRYEKMVYNRCGKTGLKLPAISLGLWHNFGDGRNMNLINFKTLYKNRPSSLT